MHKITRIGILSLTKVMAILGLGIGLVVGTLYAIGLAIVGLASGEGELVAVAAFVFIGAPFMYGLMCLIFAPIYGLIINFAFKLAGGLELEIEQGEGE